MTTIVAIFRQSILMFGNFVKRDSQHLYNKKGFFSNSALLNTFDC